jgi:hypothetical protein
MLELENITKETLEALKKATTEGILTSTGLYGYDLSGLIATIPVNVPARNNTSAFPRTIAGVGSEMAVWRALLNINAEQQDAAVGYDFAGTLAKVKLQNCFAPYRPLAKAGRVTLDAQALARNYADPLAVDTIQTLNQLFISQDMHIINSQDWSLGKPEKPKLVFSETGGTIKKGEKVQVAVAARSGANYFVGGPVIEDSSTALSGSTEGSELETVETKTTETGSIVASIKAIKGAVAYDWYVGKEAGEKFYYTTTTIAAVTIKAIPTAAEALPVLPLLSSTAPPKTLKLLEERTVKDTSYSENWYNGIIASTLGDYGAAGPVKPGSGTSSGATFLDYGGNAISGEGGNITLLDEINDSLWASVQLSPTSYMVNSLQGDEISKLLLGSTSATTFLPPTDAAARTNLAGGGFIGRYINKAAAGTEVMIEVHPRVAPGTIIARTDRVPFPGSNIGTVFEVRCQYDTMQFNYAANYNPGHLGGGPRYDYEIRSMETFVNRAPVAQAVACNIK